jgi:nuclear transport factor 2 (NTF2) superfamily protein
LTCYSQLIGQPDSRPPLPPFTLESARTNVRAAEEGNEHWEFNEHGLMQRREASINDVAIQESDRIGLSDPRPPITLASPIFHSELID